MSILKHLIVLFLMGSASLSASAPFWTWDGFYGGLNAGVIRFYDKVDFTPKGLWDDVNPELRNLIARGGNTRLTSWNFIGGGQVGYNCHFSRCSLIGIEADANVLCLFDHRQTAPVAFGLLSYQFHDRIHHRWLVTVRPRVGFVYNRFLTYVTGGFASGDARVYARLVEFTTGFETKAEACKVLNGWTVGIGGEFAYRPFVTFKFEYLHVNLGHLTTRSTPNEFFPGFFEDRRYQINHDFARFGINFRI